MLHRRRLFEASLAAGALVGSNLVTARPGRAQPVTLRVAHFWPPIANPHQNILVPWTERLTRESGGRLQFQLLPAMQVGGSPPQLVDHARNGVADIVWTLPGYTAGRFPIIEVFELPLVKSGPAAAASRAAWRFFSSTPEAQAEFAGLKVLAVHVSDAFHFHMASRPIRTIADFRGQKIRAATRQTNKMLAAIGATPVAMPLSALADALSKGALDGVMISWEPVASAKIHEVVRFHSEAAATGRSIAQVVFTMLMNPASFSRLPPDLQALIEAATGEAFSAQIGQSWDDWGAPVRQQAIARGNQVNTIDAAEITAWESRMSRLYEEWVRDSRAANGAALLERARQALSGATA